MAPKHTRHTSPRPITTLAKSTTNTIITKRRDGYGAQITPKAQARTRRDIAAWQAALKAADNVDNPRRARLQNLYSDITLDAHLTAQIEMRQQSTLAAPFVLKRGAEIDQAATDQIANAPWINELNRHVLDSTLYGHTLLEFTTTPNGQLQVTLLPRTNVVPEMGLILLKEDDTKGVDYRNAREYGTWLLEFGERHNYGLLNKAVPHVLFKKFAQACWSELCEIYGIPPRVLYTNTQDPETLSRAETMMRDLGAASWFIVDTDEKFEFAKGADTNGDVYKNMITLCDSQNSLLISCAVLGQDTVNGNRSKEQVSVTLLDKVVDADKRLLSTAWNNTILPALVRIGVVADGLHFEFQPQEDLETLWTQTHQAMQYMRVDEQWVKSKFGIEVVGDRENVTPGSTSLSASGFFD